MARFNKNNIEPETSLAIQKAFTIERKDNKNNINNKKRLFRRNLLRLKRRSHRNLKRAIAPRNPETA